MNDTIVTIRGWLGSAPRFFPPDKETGRGAATMFNVGVTPRFYSRAQGEFREGTTTWYSVRCFGNLAVNAMQCLSKGNPVLVRGRLGSRMWTDKDGAPRTSFEIVADSVGVEISTGIANFAKLMTAPPDEERGPEASARLEDELPGEGSDGAYAGGDDGAYAGGDDGAYAGGDDGAYGVVDGVVDGEDTAIDGLADAEAMPV